MSKVFRRNKWKAGSKLFDLEKDDGFRLLIPQRDFIIGGRTADDMEDGMRKSRRVIFIVSKLVLLIIIISINHTELCFTILICDLG